jgi:pSer/pThr/pTyr-binding forkhead associated (FHA) protein
MLLLRETYGDQSPREIEIPLAGTHVSFGRAEDCTYRLIGSGAVSRVQATLQKVGEDWEIIDGSNFKASSNGISISAERVDRHTLAPGDLITLFDNGDYKAILEVVSTDEQPIVSSDEETVEVPLYNMQQEVGALRDSIDSVAEGVAAIAKTVGDSNAALALAVTTIGEKVDKITIRVDAIEHDLANLIKPQLTAQSVKDQVQDHLIGRVLIGLSIALISLGGYNLSNGKSEAIDRALSVLQMVLGGGAVTTMAVCQHGKPKGIQGGPQWQN